MTMQTLDGHFGSISFDGNVVTITKKGRGATSIPVKQVSSVQILPAGLGMGGIVITASGATAGVAIKPMGSHKAIAEDPYGLTFRKKRQAEFQALANTILTASTTTTQKEDS